MIENIMALTHGFVVLMFGVILSASFANFDFSEKNRIAILFFCIFLAAIQGGVWIFINEAVIWKIYPLILALIRY